MRAMPERRAHFTIIYTIFTVFFFFSSLGCFKTVEVTTFLIDSEFYFVSLQLDCMQQHTPQSLQANEEK